MPDITSYFCFELPSVLLKKRTERFSNKYNELHYYNYNYNVTLATIYRLTYIPLTSNPI